MTHPTARLGTLAGLLALHVACQAPFGADRHDLVGDRIAAVSVEPADGALRGRVAVVADGRPWLDAPIAITWRWLDSTDPRALQAIAPDDPADGVGAAPLLDPPAEGLRRLGVVAAFPSGAIRRAFLDVGEDPTPPGLHGLAFDPPGPWAPDAAVTIEARVDASDEPPMARWMTVGGRGTFLEQSRTVTRWDAAHVERDEGEEVAREPIAEGPVTFLVLALDQRGGNAFHAEEAFVGAVPPGLWTPSGRFLGTASPVEGDGPWLATLARDDDAPTGLALHDLVAVDASAPAPALPCDETVDGAFDPTWLLEARCTRDEVVGASVLVRRR